MAQSRRQNQVQRFTQPRRPEYIISDPSWDLIIRDAKMKIAEYKSGIRRLTNLLEQFRQCRNLGVSFSEWPKYIKEKRSWRRRVI
jgi:hypothetical protein